MSLNSRFPVHEDNLCCTLHYRRQSAVLFSRLSHQKCFTSSDDDLIKYNPQSPTSTHCSLAAAFYFYIDQLTVAGSFQRVALVPILNFTPEEDKERGVKNRNRNRNHEVNVKTLQEEDGDGMGFGLHTD